MEKQKTSDLDLLRAGHPFNWGDLIQIHVLPRYAVVEYKRTHYNTRGAPEGFEPEPSFHPYVDGEDTNHSFGSLEAALVYAIAVGRPEGELEVA